jgi:hypothetical protein
MWDAACSNREHDAVGMRRTNADKRRAVRMALEARPEMSDREIARQVGVAHSFVNNTRVSVLGEQIDHRLVTRNGTTYEMKLPAREFPERTTDEGWRESRLHMQVEDEPKPLARPRGMQATRAPSL